MAAREAIMICIDNSEYMRNGDFTPTRMISQTETVNFIANHKLNSNVESSVGLLSMAGRRVELLATPSRKLHLISTALSKVPVGTTCHFMAAIKTAQLALKNRPNKAQLQRIIMFVGSPVQEEKKKLIRLGKVLKKNNVAVDVINFGTENMTNGNIELLEAFINTVNSADSSHLVSFPPGPHVMSNLVVTSSIMVPGGAGGASVAQAPAARVGGSTVAEDNDRELQMAIRMSMEETRQRQEKAIADAMMASMGKSSEEKAVTTTTAMEVEEEDDEEEDDEDEYDEEEFALALAMSMAPAKAAEDAAKVQETKAVEAKTETMDTTADNAEEGEEDLDALEDPDFIRSLIEGQVDDGDINDILDQLNEDDDA
jgi:26S proteasome regulatory subunit N10